MRNSRNPVAQDQHHRSVSLIEVISDLFDGKTASSDLPKGVKEIDRATLEATRVRFDSKVDEELLSQIAEEEGYTVEKGTYPLRVIKEGAIVLRVGSESNAGDRSDLYLYLFPPEMGRMSVYRKVVAEREGVLHPSTDAVNLEKLHKYNLELIRLVSRYLIRRYSR